MKKKIIFHLPFKPDKNKPSASQIRPYKMIDAFKGLGYEVAVVLGNARERKSQISSIKKRIKNGEIFEFLYSESSTMPTLLTEPHHLPLNPTLDFGFIRFCKNKGIPTGLFYRDIHWKFDHYELEKYHVKRLVSYLFYKLDLELYKRYLDVLYLPSMETSKHIPELKGLRIEPLPPGNDNIADTNNQRFLDNRKIHFLYVGGIGDLYNLKMFLDGVSALPPEKFQVTICTRKNDYQKVSQDYDHYFKSQNINLVHLQGSALVKLYQESDICCLFVQPTPYWEFVVPYKLFEYIAYKRPILGVKGTAVGTFLEKHNIGWSVDFNENSLKVFLEHLEKTFNVQEKKEKLKNLEQVSKDSTWLARAKFVSKSLLNIQGE